MAAAAVRRMRGTVHAKLRPSPGLQVSGVLALLLASAIMSSGLIGTKPGLPVSKRILLPDDLRTGTSVLRILDLPDSILMQSF
ncbi:keratinocyte-associated transmembrane protein 2 isoform X3 [Ursus maritimus]|uniref:Keratinocyte-associated transmembrane protein 2 isoform X3 n=1 Tax=Ursus maritimus TaxID=29073 RepID=A0A8M1F874_URSMA|nr:keratinocyte-associated transmembrane protein 2 isoform X3 [Ursus maritimus]